MTKSVSLASRLQRWLDQNIGDGRAFDDNVSLAKAADIDEGTVRNIRKGGGTTQKTVDKIAAAFGLSTSQLEARMEQLEHEQWIGSLLDDQIITGISQLPEEDKQEVYDLIQSKLRRYNRK